MKKKYLAHGTVFGNLWSGVTGSTGVNPAKPLVANTKEELIEKATELLGKGTLVRSKGDFNGLIGALLDIRCVSEIEIEGKLFTNETEEDSEWIGGLTDDQKDYFYNYMIDNNL